MQNESTSPQTGETQAGEPQAEESQAGTPQTVESQTVESRPVESLVGHEYEVEVGPVAHGGHCIARTSEGRVLFVRHTLPGEKIVARVTDGAADSASCAPTRYRSSRRPRTG